MLIRNIALKSTPAEERPTARFLYILWDLPDDPHGNIQHIAQHGITPDEVNQLLTDPRLRPETSRSSGQPIAKGRTRDGRLIAVVYEEIDPDHAYPITAFDIE